MGDHSNVLPHIVLNRSTLPWERTAIKKGDSQNLKEEKLSWLVLLLFEEGELSVTQSAQGTSNESLKTFSVGELRNPIDPTKEKIAWPGISSESGQHDSDRLSVIDVPWSLLDQIIQKLLEQSSVSVVSWFIIDNEHQTHYRIQKQENILQVYRE